MKTFAIDADNDLAVAYNARGKKDLVLEADPVVAGIIKLCLRFQLLEGEWYQDIRIGIPYFRLILVKNPDLAVVRQIFRKTILSIPVIASVDRLDMTFDKTDRRLAVYFEATATDGRRMSGGSGKPFILDNREIGYSTGLETL